jgi:hypothetical protein
MLAKGLISGHSNSRDLTKLLLFEVACGRPSPKQLNYVNVMASNKESRIHLPLLIDISRGGYQISLHVNMYVVYSRIIRVSALRLESSLLILWADHYLARQLILQPAAPG